MTADLPRHLPAAAVHVLRTPEPAEKVRLTAVYAAAWRAGGLAPCGEIEVPDRPARPPRPPLKPPRQVARRRINASADGRIALIHALAHIELNAIDLAWDLIARFAKPELPRRFFVDWAGVAEQEARHFTLLCRRLSAFGRCYGDLAAHGGLWDAAAATRHDLAARLAIAPLVLEARGLDVTPAMIDKLRAVGDDRSADILVTIYQEEIGHVRIGRRWFEFACACRGLEPRRAWQGFVAKYFRGDLKPPFNTAARDAAGMPAVWYEAAATSSSTATVACSCA